MKPKIASGTPEGKDVGGDSEGGDGVLDGNGKALLLVGGPGRVAKGGGLGSGVGSGVVGIGVMLLCEDDGDA